MIDNYPAAMRPFIEAILANPQDDAPVLIFADWLEENGWPEMADIMRKNTNLGRDTVKGSYFFYWIDPVTNESRSLFPPQVPAAGV